jgi:protein subunit release factor B
MAEDTGVACRRSAFGARWVCIRSQAVAAAAPCAREQNTVPRTQGKLLARVAEARAAEIAAARGEAVVGDWGSQIRSYVLQPYRMVKDLRTGWETTDADGFLEGEHLDDVAAAYLQWSAEREAGCGGRDPGG